MELIDISEIKRFGNSTTLPLTKAFKLLESGMGERAVILHRNGIILIIPEKRFVDKNDVIRQLLGVKLENWKKLLEVSENVNLIEQFDEIVKFYAEKKKDWFYKEIKLRK